MDPLDDSPSIGGGEKERDFPENDAVDGVACDAGVVASADAASAGRISVQDVSQISVPEIPAHDDGANRTAQPPAFKVIVPVEAAAPTKGATGEPVPEARNIALAGGMERRVSAMGGPRPAAAPLQRAEQPSDFFDLGDLDEGRGKAKSPASRLRSAIPLAGFKSEPARDERDGRSVSVSDRASVAPPAAGGGDRQGQAAEAPTRRSTSRKANAREKAIVRGRKRKIAFSIVVSVCIVAIAISGVLFWNAYLRYDDVADIQGEWQVADGSMTVVIDEDSISMPESLVYGYTLDTWKKEISFSFQDLSGSGVYRFSPDRKGLVIREGEGDAAILSTFVKVSDDTAAEPHEGSASADGNDAAASDASGGAEGQGAVDGGA
ncbi:MAG: hypothetical protein Q4B69_00160 [Slackia sp.]|nr:hypothetical protein [Slackia sp.]